MKQTTRNIFCALSLLACFALLPNGAQAVMLLQSEGFGGGIANGWGVASQVITIESDGGPEGAGDNFLSYTSTGSGSAGARMIIPNEDPGNPFHGDYQQAGVSELVFDVLNQGATDLDLRLAIGNGAAWYVSDPATKVTPGGPWSSVAFALDSGEMTALSGTDSLSEVLSDVIQIRLLSSTGLPSMGVAGPRGDQIAASIGIDNVRTIPEPSALLLCIAALACSRSRR